MLARYVVIGALHCRATEGMINNLPEPDKTPNLIVFMECA